METNWNNIEDGTPLEGAQPLHSPNGQPTNGAGAAPTKPDALRVRFENIPDDLTLLPQWVLWRYEYRADQKKPWTKVPYQPSGRKADSTEPQTWSKFEKVCAAYTGSSFDGIGFALSPDEDLIGVDMDAQLVGDRWSQAVGDTATSLNTYGEISPSGEGVRFFGRGELPQGKRKNGDFEIYSSGRYLTVTGHQLEGTPDTVNECGAALLEYHARYIAKHSPRQKPRAREATPLPTLDDHALLDKARGARNGAKFALLFDGGTVNGLSEDDAALCSMLAFWTRRDAGQMERLLRSSGRVREKWDEPRGDSTWILREIENAIQHTSDVYDPTPTNTNNTKERGIPATPPEADEWGEALSLQNALLPVPALPPVLIPEPLRAWIFDCAERIDVAPDYLAVSALVALASLVGNTVSARPKKCDDWRVVPNLWGACVGSPSVKKSPAIAEALKPLYRLKALEVERWRAAMKEWEADALLNELDADALKSELKKRRKNSTREELKAFIEEASAGEFAKPVLKTYSLQDATLEALTGVLTRNPRGVLIERDELTGWLRALDKQGHEQDRAFFLEAFSGTKRNDQIERIGRGTLIMPHNVVSIVGTIQPHPLTRLIRAAASGAQADGFIARFQMMVYPDAPPEYRHVDRWPDKDAKNRAFGIFEALDKLTPENAGAQLDDDDETHFLRFDGAAQEVFDDWITEHENRLRSMSGLIEQHLAKYRSLMPSLALLFHLISVADGSAAAGSIGDGAAMMAAEWCQFLEAHARRIYAMAGDGATDGAELIAARLGQLPNPFTLREVHQKRWMGLAERDDVESALARLEDRGWIRPQFDGGETGRPTLRYWKHPAKAGEK